MLLLLIVFVVVLVLILRRRRRKSILAGLHESKPQHVMTLSPARRFSTSRRDHRL